MYSIAVMVSKVDKRKIIFIYQIAYLVALNENGFNLLIYFSMRAIESGFLHCEPNLIEEK